MEYNGIVKKQITWLILNYLRLLAKAQLLKIQPKHIVGITGSAGKSTCREMVYAVLSAKYHCKQSSTGNSESGIPLDILGLQMQDYSVLDWLRVCLLAPWQLLTNWKRYGIYVVEMGIDGLYEPKNMDYLLKIIRPDIAVILNVLPVHTEFLGTLENIAKEKFKIITKLGIINEDDPLLVQLAKKSGQKNIHFFGRAEKIELKGYLWHEGLAYTVGAALKAGEILGVEKQEAIKALKSGGLKLPAGRGTIISGIKDTIIIDSSYNSSPGPAAAALRAAAAFAAGHRLIAILGDMRELGELTQVEHERLAALALQTCDYIFTVGALTQKYFTANTKTRKFLEARKAIPEIKEFIKKGDVILVKGSQNTIFLEQIVEALMRNPADAEHLLCRRGAFWEKKRKGKN